MAHLRSCGLCLCCEVTIFLLNQRRPEEDTALLFARPLCPQACLSIFLSKERYLKLTESKCKAERRNAYIVAIDEY